ncbi:hypothetical protein V6A89_003875 [Enterobacter hormaechei]
MAFKLRMENRRTGEWVTGMCGFSWTTLFFGPFPALFRRDFRTFIFFMLATLLLGLYTLGVGAIALIIIWAFKYNGFYTNRLIRKGFSFAGTYPEKQLNPLRLTLRFNADNLYYPLQ